MMHLMVVTQMNNIMIMLRNALGELKEQKGATAVEYALMVTFIAMVIVAAVALLGGTVTGLFPPVTAAL